MVGNGWKTENEQRSVFFGSDYRTYRGGGWTGALWRSANKQERGQKWQIAMASPIVNM
jgi:hypothetical protein